MSDLYTLLQAFGQMLYYFVSKLRDPQQIFEPETNKVRVDMTVQRATFNSSYLGFVIIIMSLRRWFSNLIHRTLLDLGRSFIVANQSPSV